MSAAQFDSELQGMLLDRRRLLEEYAPTLRRKGPNAGQATRKRENAQLRVKRGALRQQIRKNAEAIAARCMHLFGEETP